MFRSIAHESSLTQRAQVQIEDLIVGGALARGDRLPSERELTERLQVSKTVVREAIRALVGKGLLEVRAGSGVYVRHFGSDVIEESMKLLLRANVLKPADIHEIRTILEVNIAGLAAARAQASDLEAMEKTIRALDQPKLTAIAFAQTDVAFHNHLALSAGNPLCSVLVSSLNGVMIEVRLRAFHLQGATLTAQRAISYHSRILERVSARDVEGARQAMQEHLAGSLQTLQRVAEALSWDQLGHSSA